MSRKKNRTQLVGVKNKALHYRLWATLEEAIRGDRPPVELAMIKKEILSNTIGGSLVKGQPQHIE